MRYDLAAMAARAKPGRRKPITFRDTPPPAMLAQSLFARAYRPMLDRWNARIPAIVVEYARTLSAITTDSPADLQAQLDAASSEMERLFILLDAAVRSWCLETETWSREAWRGAVLSATGVDLGVFLGPEEVRETLESYIGWNVRLIRDVSSQAAKRIGDAVFAGLQNRTPAREVAKQIQEAMGMSRRRALGVASDQLSKVTSALADERRREAGLSVWKWRHSGKKHPRSWHVQRNGNLYSDDPAMVGREVDGKTVETPPAADDLPGRPPWCGCRSSAVLILD
ncbi:phage minor head protein [Sphingomonas sp.]|uniref:phage minor head protein n=1 Tax=Sphingomonas sp. TaxID=28214 RepID=UPI002FD88A79